MNKVVLNSETDTKGFYFLWHLVALGVIVPDETGLSFETTLWDELERKGETRPARVAMIDVGCSPDHPNLQGRIDTERSIDFTVSPYGTRTSACAEEQPKGNFSGLNTGDLTLEGLSKDELAIFGDIAQQLEQSKGDLRTIGDIETLFASHGTAVSGLVVGGPEPSSPDAAPTPGVIPYFGVDPFSQLISIRTGFDNDPLQFIAALLYAWHQKADVIVMPRGLPDPEHNPVDKNDFQGNLERWENREAADLIERINTLQKTAADLRPTEPQHSLTGKRLWHIVRSLFVAVSSHIPIVCASGNEGESQLIYPANLANRENGIIAVGAVTGKGYRSGYSNYGDGLTVVAPSDDMTVFNRHQLRDTAKNTTSFEYLLPSSAKKIPYSRMWLLSTDIPGRFGYDTGDDTPEDTPAQSGYYTQFGGTSGACALVAGVIALIRRAERLAGTSGCVMDGRDVKALLIKTARKDMVVGGETLALKTDAMNTDGEDVAEPSLFFGSGLVDAKAALEAVLP